MQSIAKVVAVAAMIAAGLALGKPLHGEEAKKGQIGKPSEPKRSMEESPFGGPPPPMARGAVAKGTKCPTVAGTCVVNPAQPIGTPCSCGDTGKKAEGKVHR